MPIYTNTTEYPITAPGYPTVVAGGSLSTHKYVYPLPTGLELTNHMPAPWVTLHAGTLPCEITSGLAAYSEIVIVNATGALITIVVNTDEQNPLVVLNSTEYHISQVKEVDAIEITGDRTGKCYVYGLKPSVP